MLIESSETNGRIDVIGGASRARTGGLLNAIPRTFLAHSNILKSQLMRDLGQASGMKFTRLEISGAKFSGTVSEPGADSFFLDEDRSVSAPTHDSPREIFLTAPRVWNEVLGVDADATHHGRRLREVLHRQCGNGRPSLTTPPDFRSSWTTRL